MKVLAWFRLVDEDGLSITNLACYIALFKVATSQNASVADLGVLIIALLNYAHRRYTQSQLPDVSPLTVDSATLAADLESVKSKVNALMVTAGVREMRKL